MNVAVIGAGRSRNGIGEYIAKYLHRQGMAVEAVLGRSMDSAVAAAQALEQYGIAARAYADFAEMMFRVRPEAVVIASPTPTHVAYIEACLEAGVHCFCDKPFLAPETANLSARLERMLRMAEAGGLVVGMNSQWPFTLPFYEELCGRIDPQETRTFDIRLSPLTAGKGMIADSVPHALSLLYCALGEGGVEDLGIQTRGEEEMRLSFGYRTPQGRCTATITLVRQTRQPRSFAYGFDGRIVTRAIDLASYALSFEYQGKTLPIPDPLELSVQDFLAALDKGRAPLIGPAHIRATTELLHQIHAGAGHGEQDAYGEAATKRT